MNIKKGQVSVEMLVVLAFAFVLIGGTSYYFMGFLSDTQNDVAATQATNIGNVLLKNVNDASSGNGYYKQTLHLAPPGSLTGIIAENKMLVLSISKNSKENSIILQSNNEISTKIVPSEIPAGIFTIEKVNDVVVICTGTSCSCDNIESGPIECFDGLDNDCNGFIDGNDIACGGIPPVPSPVNMYFYGYAYSENAGFISFNSSRYWVTLNGNNLEGYAYGENFGYISFRGPSYGVTLNGNNLEGYAYSDNIGFISFNGTTYQVVNNSNNIQGFAYSENIGFISFNGTGYEVSYQS